MRLFTNALSLPSTLLLLIVTASDITASEKQWPYNLPPHIKYFPEDEVHVKKSSDIQSRLATQIPSVIQKMSADEGEMFFLDYWHFDAQNPQELLAHDEARSSLEYLNQSFIHDAGLRRSRSNAHNAKDTIDGFDFLLPPFPLHAESSIQRESLLRFLRRKLVERNYQCPAGTNDCSSIGRPNNCCATDETCMIVTNTGNGDVGCCPAGSSCGGQVSDCDTAAGYSSCPGSPNGGCCIPGFACQDIGCKSLARLRFVT